MTVQIYISEAPKFDTIWVPPFIRTLEHGRYMKSFVNDQVLNPGRKKPISVYFPSLDPSSASFRYDSRFGDDMKWTESGLKMLESWRNQWLKEFVQPIKDRDIPVNAIQFDHARFAEKEERRLLGDFQRPIAETIIQMLADEFPTAHIGMYGVAVEPRPTRTINWNITGGSQAIGYDQVASDEPWDDTVWIRGYGRPDGKANYPQDREVDFLSSYNLVARSQDTPGAMIIWTPASQMQPRDWSRMLFHLCLFNNWPLVPEHVDPKVSDIIAQILRNMDDDGVIRPGETTMTDLLFALKNVGRP